MSSSAYPKTYENGAGERVTFHGLVQHAEGETLEGRNVVDPGCGPPMHAHLRQVEGFRVRSGRMTYQIRGEEPQIAETGASVAFAPGVPHRFTNSGDEPLVLEGYFRPPDNGEYYLAQLFMSMLRNGGRPGLFDLAFLQHRYGNEFAMYILPHPLQRLLVFLLYHLGRWTGRFNHFDDAPPPLPD